MMTATSSTAGGGKSHWACRWAQRDRRAGGPGRPPASIVVCTRALALGAVEQVLEIFLRLREYLGGRRALDAFLDGDADDVAILGDADDLRQALAADLERGLVGLVPVGRHLRLGLHLRVVPGGGPAPPPAG